MAPAAFDPLFGRHSEIGPVGSSGAIFYHADPCVPAIRYLDGLGRLGFARLSHPNGPKRDPAPARQHFSSAPRPDPNDQAVMKRIAILTGLAL